MPGSLSRLEGALLTDGRAGAGYAGGWGAVCESPTLGQQPCPWVLRGLARAGAAAPPPVSPGQGAMLTGRGMQQAWNPLAKPTQVFTMPGLALEPRAGA